MKNNISPPGKENSRESDREKIKTVAEIVQILVKTFSQMKIFSLEHENVQKFSDQLYDKIKAYLEEYWKLEIGIEEFSFALGDNIIYTDEQIIKSLPFFFFKDGMKMLYFYKDLEKEEFLDFLEIIQRDSSLPPEESDIVSTFWERDFTHIRYYAPDEHLESKIGAGMEVMEYEVDKGKLFSGKIELDQEDRQALAKGSGLARKILQEEQEAQPEDSEPGEESDIPAASSALTESELEKMKHLIQENRETPQDQELLALLIEMIYLEERPDKFSSTLHTLEECLQDMISKGEFAIASETIFSIQKLEQSLDSDLVKKKDSIEKFLQNTRNESALLDLKKIYQKDKVKDQNAYLNYLRLTGPDALSLLGYIFEEEQSIDVKRKVMNIIEEIGTADIPALMKTADNSRPELTKGIIGILSSSSDKRAIQYLANFFSYKNKEIRTETIKALGRFKTTASNKILTAFLSDQDEGLRILAVNNLHFLGEESLLEHISKIVLDKTFVQQNLAERKAYLDFLGQTQKSEACRSLDTVVKKGRLFSRVRTVETSLHAVSVLASIDTPAALTALKANVRSRNKKIRSACRSAIKSIP